MTLLCRIAQALRLAWYAEATQFMPTWNGTSISPQDQERIDNDRAKPEYWHTLSAYIEHRVNCPECKERRQE